MSDDFDGIKRQFGLADKTMPIIMSEVTEQANAASALRLAAFDRAFAMLPGAKPDDVLALAQRITSFLLDGQSGPTRERFERSAGSAAYTAAFDAGEAPGAAATRLGVNVAAVYKAYQRIRRERGIPPLSNAGVHG